MIGTRTRGEGCLSDLRLDALLATELATAEAAAARQHLESCAICTTRFTAIEQDRAAFRAAPPRLVLAQPRRWWRWAMPAFAIVAAAMVFLLVRPRSEPDDGTRTKGGDRLGFYVDRDGHVQLGATGEVLHPGDRVRFTVTTREPMHLVVASVDGSGAISVYASSAIPAGADQPLPDSIELDDVLGVERVFAFFCDRPTAVEAVRAALAAPDPQLAGCRTDVLSWTKRAR